MNQWPPALDRTAASRAAAPPEPRAAQAQAEAASVCIALSTHDGSAFLADQLRSFLAQSHTAWTILWRDDGSIDDTPAMMRAFAEAEGAGRVIDANDGRGRLGITGSFMALVRRVPPGRILAFADQDDVWLDDKIARGVAALRRLDPDRPALYCTRQALVDAELHRLGDTTKMSQPAGFPQSLTQNIATGCTVMLNPAAVGLLAAMHAPSDTLHDWWAYLVVTAAGGQVLVDDKPTVLYRQHHDNAVGVKLAFWPRALAALRRGPAAFMATFRAHVAALEEQHDLLDPDAQRTLAVIAAALRGGLAQRLSALRLAGFRRQNFAETMLFRLWFLVG